MSVLRRTPATAILIVAMWLFYFLDGELVSKFGLSAPSVGGLVVLTLMALGLSAPAEYVLRTKKYVVVGLAFQIICAPLALVTARGIEISGLNQWGDDLLHSNNLTPIGWIAGTAGFASASMSRLWRRRFRVALLALTLTSMLYSGSLSDVLGVVAAVTSIVAGVLVHSEQRTKPSVKERRTLVAIVAGAVALGPFLVAINPSAEGPFSQITQLIWAPTLSNLEVGMACGLDSASAACLAASDLARMQGIGPAVANLMPLVIQLVLCFGLIRGRRLAWWLASALQIFTMALRVIQVWDFDRENFFIYGLNLVAVLTPWAFTLVVLILTRRLFSVNENRVVLRKYLGIAAITGFVCAAVWFLGAVIFPDSFVGGTSPSAALQELPLRFMPTVVALMLPHAVLPSSWLSWLLYEWVGNVFWTVCAVLLYRAFTRPADPVQEADRRRAREILEATSGDHLSFMTIWQGNRYFFHEDSYVAYRVANGIALTLGAPVGKDISLQFEEFAREQGWTPAWYSVSAEYADAHPQLKRLEVAEEAVLSCENTEFKGKKFQNIRTARNKAKKEGIETHWTEWDDLTRSVASKIEALSEDWVSEKALPEMGFTLGGLTEMQEPGTKILYAIDEQGKLHGVTSWMPVRRSGEIVGYTLDVMRREDDAFKGVMEFLLSEALLIAASEGKQWISLSGAPLAGEHEDPKLLDAALTRVGSEIEPLYGFRSLAASKRKFQPEEVPWYLCYEDELSLPSIGLSVLHAYLPTLRASDALSVVKTWSESRKS
ncbi:bifunctional lysylphosphatidylglycerol flippase/synthetase MprF [Corynebacterium flavescens]|uniref:bifunctional lysylphosphatidylglycerol flippase/synthetase MprF n=1 Tax=Corynebacterium flavescens TaxID=28028 RepID=UPI002649BF0E|nr:DUF2156 domain-containing protein [Corynebacterium flavescens]MDN6226723.1 phosphatidylglycerol lysyltransferase domain-containing protein [Corynebacterium flavescens]